MKIIIRNRNKQIQVSNITSKEEMVWIMPELYADITKDAGAMATEFMQKYPQIHEVKFSVLPQVDEEEDEDEYAQMAEDEKGGEEQQRIIVIIGEELLQEKIDYYASLYPDDHWTMEQIREHLAEHVSIEEFGDSVSAKVPDTCHVFKPLRITSEVAVYEYKGISKC